MRDTLAQWLQNRRSEANQTPEGFALLLRITPQEYQQLENGKIPDEDLLQRICELFEWNYHEVKQLVRIQGSRSTIGNQNPFPNQSIEKEVTKSEFQGDPQNFSPSFENVLPDFSSSVEDDPRPQFAIELEKARIQSTQTENGMAVLLNIDPDEYLAYEQGLVPPEKQLQRICQLFQWNYNEILRGIRFQATRSLFTRPSSNRTPNETRQLLQSDPQTSEDSFGKILADARKEASQTLEGVAVLLHIDPEELQMLENSEALPGESLLQRISFVFGWNYKDLQVLVKAESFRKIKIHSRPIQTTTSGEANTIQKLCEQITKLSSKGSSKELKVIRIQMELILATLEKL